MSKQAIRHYPVSRSFLNTVERLTQATSKADYRLFCHLLADTFRRIKRLQKSTVPDFNGGGWIPIQKQQMNNWFYVGKGPERERANPKRLQEQGLVEIYEKYVPGLTARKYRIAPSVMDVLEIASLSEPISPQQPLFDLVTGKPWQAKWAEIPMPSVDYTELNDDTPFADVSDTTLRLVESATNAIRTCHYNREALELHLEKCRLAYLEAMEEGDNSRAQYLKNRLINDLSIFRELPPHSPFRPTYFPQRSGRIGTPMQNLTGESKAAAYGGIPNLYNYDLSSSQLRICRYYEFPRHGIECPWLDTFLSGSEMRDEYATTIGITSEAFKEAVIGVLMGSRLPSNGSDTRASIFQALRDGLSEGINSLEDIDEMIRSFKDLIAPLKTALNTWHSSISKKLEDEGVIINALHLPLTLDSVNGHLGGSKRGTIAAHILQGTEAKFIHTLTLLSEKYDFQVIGNEHDGLITLGQIPEAAIQKAREITGLDCLELREKPFK